MRLVSNWGAKIMETKHTTTKHWTHKLPEAGEPIKRAGDIAQKLRADILAERAKLSKMEGELQDVENDILVQAKHDWTLEEIAKARGEA